MNRDDAIALVRSSAFADRLDRILPHLRPSMRIHTQRDPAAAQTLVSRFAGHAFLPRGASWPVWDSSDTYRRIIEQIVAMQVSRKDTMKSFWEGRIALYERIVRDNPKPIPFLGIVRLADVAADAARLGLPERGALLVFYDYERCHGSSSLRARGAWQILYVEDESDLVPIDEPRAPPRYVASPLTFESQYALPDRICGDRGEPEFSVYEDPEYDRLHRALLGPLRVDFADHQLGGLPQEGNHSVFLECQLASKGVRCAIAEDFEHPRARALEPGAEDWQLLLQISADLDGPGWKWGHVGRIYFCVRKDDLSARRFDRTWCVVSTRLPPVRTWKFTDRPSE